MRWSESKGDEQLWLPIPLADEKVKFMTPQKGHEGEYMSVGSNGNILRWEATGIEQEFKLVNPTSDGWWEIQESTESEHVTVVSGNVRRWKRTGDADQRFKFEAWNAREKPKVVSGREPGQIGDVPRLKSVEDIPLETTEPSLIAETPLPATVVDDPDFSSKLVQVERTPYYILRREQFWDRTGDRGFMIGHSGTTEDKTERSIRYLVTNTQGRSSETTLGFQFSVKGGYSRKLPVSTVSVELSTTISQQIKTREHSEQQTQKEDLFVYTRTFPKGPPIKIVGWTLVDRYSIVRMDGTLIAQWEVALSNNTIVDGFPRDCTAPYRVDD
ncbi:MAG: hypothetical protein KIT00_07785, partial [Rhodospirillales bacterium]|nr:hypothetical protein [Rhodospirillales bacterium]